MRSTGYKAASGICAAIDITEVREAKMRVPAIRTFPPKLGFVFVPHSRWNPCLRAAHCYFRLLPRTAIQHCCEVRSGSDYGG